jgi:hypothetical protein
VSDEGKEGSLSDWLARFGVSWPRRRDPIWSRSLPKRVEECRPTRVLRRFVDTLRAIEHPVLLDLGQASGQTIGFLGNELACRLVVSDLAGALDAATERGGAPTRSEVIQACFDREPDSIDGVLCWDLCDYLDAEEAGALTAGVARVLKPGGVTIAVFSTVTYDSSEVMRFAIEDTDHIMHRPAPSAMRQHQVWLSRDIVQLFKGLHVDEMYLLAHGEREVLVKKHRAGR